MYLSKLNTHFVENGQLPPPPPSSPIHHCLHARTLLKSKKLEQRARREQAKLGVEQKSLPTTPTSCFPAPSKQLLSPLLLKQRCEQEKEKEWAPLKASDHAQNTVNPIRKICDSLAVPPNKGKQPIRLNLGDPTLTGNLPPSSAAIAAMHDVIDSHKFDGYGPAVGILSAREAIVKHYSTPEAPFTADDVILASGCSHALEMALVAIANPGDNVLVPIPGFPLYTTLCKPNGIETRQYRLKMHENGLIDLEHLEESIDANTKAILINNPSNPTGVVLPKEHLEAVLKIAHKHKVAIIADEIYGDLVYDGAKFHPMASLSPKVPIITCDGIAKRYLVPGWRLGWLIVHDRYGVLSEVKKGIVALSQKIVGPCALVQGALPRLLDDTPQSYFENIRTVIAKNAQVVYEVLSRVPGLKPLKPQGAMYMMIGFDWELYGDETHFMRGLIQEESVYCLPGSAFSLPNWFRLVLTYPEEVTREACERIVDYCERQLRPCNYLSSAVYHRRGSLEDEGSASNTESDDSA